jgi:cytochrome c oxidase subunit 2
MKSWKLLLIAMIAISVLTACGGEASTEQASEKVESTSNVVDLNIDATNFKFDQEEYRVSAGDTVNLSLTSSEGIHGILIKGIDITLKDGEATTFVAEPGEYEIICNIMCGSGHAKMISTLIVE